MLHGHATLGSSDIDAGLRRVRLIVGALVFAVALVVVNPTTALAVNPHGTYSSSSKSCQLCHDLHSADGETILASPSEKLLCYSCHDGTGSSFNTRAAFAESSLGTTTAKSSHPVPSGAMQCASCHTPHEGPSENNIRSLKGGSAEATTGIAVCGGCHGSGSALPGGNLAVPIAGTPHASITSSASAAGIACVACHEPHASSNADLVRSTLRTESQTTVTVSGEPGLCLGCHQDASGEYNGGTLAAIQKHSTVTTSTKALTSWPGASGSAAGCDGCHEPHGTGSGPSYTRVADRALCSTCHDAAALVYPAGYSYRGGATFASSGHNGISSPGINYVSVLADPPGFSAWESTSLPTPSSPGAPVSAERASALLTSDGVRLVTDLQQTDGDWDYQTYRFKVSVPKADATAVRVHWEGYGEEAAGFPVVLSAWNINSGAWDMIRSAQMPTQTTASLPLSIANHVTSDGTVYLMAKARYSRDAALISGPTITALSGTSARVEWVTSGMTSSYVDYGTTSSYTKTAGSATRVQNHVVTITGLVPGVWNFRVRSVAFDGTSYTSANIVQGIPRPTLTAVGSVVWTGVNASRTLNWAAPVGAPGGPFQFRTVLNKDGVLLSSTDWSTDTSRTVSLGLGTYTWRVQARDASGNSYDYSIWNTFYIYEDTGSCPFLYTWDGGKFVFEADLYGPGKLALKTKTGYSKPTPDDVYVLKTEPAVKDGAFDLRLVEERFEVDYLDKLKLYAIDVPADREVYAEKREAGGSPFPGVSGVLHTVSKQLSAPVSAVNITTGEDVLSLVAHNDDVFEVLSRDRNSDFGYETIELDLGDVKDAPQVKIVMDAMSVFPSTVEGAAYAATFGARTKLEVQDESGAWVAVPTSLGALPKPPEFSRPYVFDITRIWKSDSRRVRFTFLLKQYIDWIAVDTTSDLPVTITEVPLLSAELRAHGFNPKTTEEEIFGYVYGDPTDRMAYLPGEYTKFGEVKSLLGDVDDKFVIYGGGDELALSFQPLDPAGAGTTRRYAVHTNGYYKDLKTEVVHTVEPLPFAAMSNFPYAASESYPYDAEHQAYLDEWNTRVHGAETIETAAAAELSFLENAVSWVRTAAVQAWDKVVALVAPTAGAGAVEVAAEEPLHRSLNTDVVALEVTGVEPVSANACSACHAPHGGADSGKLLTGGRGAADGRTCLGDGAGGCHDNAVNSASGIDIRTTFTASANLRAHHDVIPADQRASGGVTACGDCHNPHRDNASIKYADPDDPAQTIASPLASVVSTTGTIWALVGASHDAVAPAITDLAITSTVTSQTSPTVTWNTLNDASTSWVDWGVTTSYELGNATSGSPFGNNTLVTLHSVKMSSLTTGTVYHYRVRSSDALGNTSVSADQTYKVAEPPAVPVVSVATTLTGTGAGPVLVPASSTTVTCPDGDPVEYQFQLGAVTSAWMSTTSWPGTWFYNGTYTARVRARDAVDLQAVSAWSATKSFTVINAPEPTESCPNLFAWDGEQFGFVTDVMGLGPIGVKKGKDAYLKAEPVEDTVIPPGSLVARDGSLDIHLTDERSEIEYIDEIKLVAVDHPTGTRLLINDLHWGPFDGGRDATEYYTIADPKPVKVEYERTPVLGTETVALTDVSAEVAEERDGVIAYGGLYDDNVWTFDLGELNDPARIKLVVAGWVDYADKTEKAAWIASGKRPPASFIEVQDADGNWVTLGDAPHPPGYTKTVVYDFTDAFPEGVTRYVVRMHTYMRLNLDYVAVDTTADGEVTLTELATTIADLSFKGTSSYQESPYPQFNYDDLLTATPQNQSGAFTRYGDVAELLADADDRFVIMDTGDDLAMSFAEPSAPVTGFERTYVLHTDGFHDTQSASVDPLPFHAMSSYPYPDSERYPSDEFHTRYLAEWNTRIKDGKADPIMAASLSSWAEYHVEAWTTEEDEFSVDSDMFVARMERKDGSVATITVAAGWESESSETVKPSPSSPGASVGAGTLASLSADDGNYWRTNLATADMRWNWQVMRLDLGSTALTEIKSITFAWNGHGEPTAGYPTSVSLWNPLTSAWTQVKRVQMASDMSVSKSVTSISETFCLRCHDGAPPAGVKLTAGLTNVGATWNASDYHGGASRTSTTGLKFPYSLGQDAIGCSTCHDTHGTGSLYHIPAKVNGQTVATVATGSDYDNLCSACHAGNAGNWHPEASCWCHVSGDSEHGLVSVPLDNAMDCSTCHFGHKSEFIHNCVGGCH